MYLFLVLMMYTSSTAQSSFKNYVQTKTYLDNAGTTFLWMWEATPRRPPWW